MKIDFTENELLLIQDAIIYERDYGVNINTMWKTVAGEILSKIKKKLKELGFVGGH